MGSALDVFVLVSGSFSILATLPLLYLALHTYRDGSRLRRLQLEVAELMVEVHQLQGEIRHDQQATITGLEDTKRTVERVAARRRIPRLSVRLVR